MPIDVKTYIMHLYNRDVVGPATIPEDVKRSLMTGLEEVLNGIDFPDNAKIKVAKNPGILEVQMDYNAMRATERELRYSGVTARLAKVLGGENIHTYGDLVKYVERQIKTRNPVNVNGVRRIRIGKGVGVRSLVLLYRHLNSVGIKLFGIDYTMVELGELRTV